MKIKVEKEAVIKNLDIRFDDVLTLMPSVGDEESFKVAKRLLYRFIGAIKFALEIELIDRAEYDYYCNSLHGIEEDTKERLYEIKHRTMMDLK